MAEITKNFTYDIPNEYLSQSNSDGDTATASYTGQNHCISMLMQQAEKIHYHKMQLHWVLQFT